VKWNSAWKCQKNFLPGFKFPAETLFKILKHWVLKTEEVGQYWRWPHKTPSCETPHSSSFSNWDQFMMGSKWQPSQPRLGFIWLDMWTQNPYSNIRIKHHIHGVSPCNYMLVLGELWVRGGLWDLCFMHIKLILRDIHDRYAKKPVTISLQCFCGLTLSQLTEEETQQPILSVCIERRPYPATATKSPAYIKINMVWNLFSLVGLW
jgi:hypothetical protein